MELSTSLAAFLEFALEAAKDVVGSKATRAAHTDETLRLHRRATLDVNGGSLTSEVGRITLESLDEGVVSFFAHLVSHFRSK